MKLKRAISQTNDATGTICRLERSVVTQANKKSALAGQKSPADSFCRHEGTVVLHHETKKGPSRRWPFSVKY